jgi:hypothetical protein
VELAGLDERRDLWLRLADAPRRLGTETHCFGLATIGGIKHFIGATSHAILFINLVDMCQDN